MVHWTQYLDPAEPDGAYLSWKEVGRRVGISRTTAWRLQKAGDFPKPYVMSAGRVAYREREVEAWKASRAHRTGDGLLSRPPSSPPRAAAAAPAGPATPAPRDAPGQARLLRLPLDDPEPRRDPVLPATRRRRGTAPGRAEQITFEF